MRPLAAAREAVTVTARKVESAAADTRQAVIVVAAVAAAALIIALFALGVGAAASRAARSRAA